MLWIVLCVTLAVVESGDWSANAQKLFEEVYGKKLAAAKTPQAKALLARELLELAKKEADSDAKKIELQTAKRLAIDAESPALALDIVRALVEAFPETSLSQDELLERAELLWKEGESRKSRERLQWKCDAVEMWLRAKVTGGLVFEKWQSRLSSLSQARSLHIIGIYWGAKERYWDVTRLIVPQPTDTGLKIGIPPDMFDPLRGVHKILVVVYALDGELKVATVYDADIPREVVIPCR